MSKIFVGTITVNDQDYEVRGPLALNNSRLTGTLSFVSDTNYILPISGIISAGSITTSQNLFFITPSDIVVKILPLQAVDTSINADFTTIAIEASIEIGEEEGTLSIAIESEEIRIGVGGIDENAIDEVNPRTKKKLQKIRINEVGNLFDHFGSILSLPRINGEDNNSYSERIRSIPSKRRGSDYTGLLNAITTELALAHQDTIDVFVKSEIVHNKRLLVEEGYIRLYEEWVSEEDQKLGLRPTLEKEARLGQEPIKTVGKLVDWINDSNNFGATLIQETNLSTEFLVHFDSRVVVQEELVGQEIIHFSYGNIVPGSVFFLNNNTLKKERGAEEVLDSLGDYQIDYKKGLLKCFSAPLKNLKFTYTVNNITFKLQMSDIKVIDLLTKGAQRLYFDQINRVFYNTLNESTINGLPTEEMFGIIKEILTAGDFDQYWGE